MGRDPDSRLVYTTESGRIRARQEPEASVSAARAGARLWLDRRGSGRVVTLVTGVPGQPADLQRLVQELKAACGTGGTLKNGAIELQGDHRDLVEGFLRARGVASKRAGGS